MRAESPSDESVPLCSRNDRAACGRPSTSRLDRLPVRNGRFRSVASAIAGYRKSSPRRNQSHVGCELSPGSSKADLEFGVIAIIGALLQQFTAADHQSPLLLNREGRVLERYAFIHQDLRDRSGEPPKTEGREVVETSNRLSHLRVVRDRHKEIKELDYAVELLSAVILHLDATGAVNAGFRL